MSIKNLRTTINDRFQAIIDALYNGNKRAFSSAIGVTPTVVENVVGTRKGKPSFDVLAKVCANANISERWLILGEGEMCPIETKEVANREDVPSAIVVPNEYSDKVQRHRFGGVQAFLPLDDNYHKAAKNVPGAIPLVSERAVGGYAGESSQIPDDDVLAYYVIPKFRHKGVDFLIEVTGDSMVPHIHSGDIVACAIVHNYDRIVWNHTYLVASNATGLVVKRIHKADDDSCLRMVSDNPAFTPFDLPKDEIFGLARVIGTLHLE